MPWYVWVCVGMAGSEVLLDIAFSIGDRPEWASPARSTRCLTLWVALATFLLVLSRGG